MYCNNILIYMVLCSYSGCPYSISDMWEYYCNIAGIIYMHCDNISHTCMVLSGILPLTMCKGEAQWAGVGGRG